MQMMSFGTICYGYWTSVVTCAPHPVAHCWYPALHSAVGLLAMHASRRIFSQRLVQATASAPPALGYVVLTTWLTASPFVGLIPVIASSVDATLPGRQNSYLVISIPFRAVEAAHPQIVATAIARNSRRRRCPNRHLKCLAVPHSTDTSASKRKVCISSLLLTSVIFLLARQT